MSSHSGTWNKTVFTYGIILLGSGILSFGLYNIHERTNVTEGGVLGMTLLLQHWFGFSPSVTSPLMDIACYLLAWRFLGNAFARYALAASLAFAGFHALWEQFPPLLPDLSAYPAIAAVAATIGRLAMDVCLFMSQNFGFVSLPDELTTGSSIMPHKKNPDVFEIMRGRCNRLQSVPNEIALLTTNLPVGYHRDLQLLKDILFPATTEIKRTLAMCDFMLAHIRVNEHILDDKKYDYLFTVEDVNRMVLAGTPFREAYKQVGMAVQRGEYTPTREVRHTHEGSIGNLCTAQIRRKMERVMQEFE